MLGDTSSRSVGMSLCSSCRVSSVASPGASYINACLISVEIIVGKLNDSRVMDVGQYEGANQADRWRKRMRQGRHWRASRNFVTWLLILVMIAIFSTLIALNAHWRF